MRLRKPPPNLAGLMRPPRADKKEYCIAPRCLGNGVLVRLGRHTPAISVLAHLPGRGISSATTDYIRVKSPTNVWDAAKASSAWMLENGIGLATQNALLSIRIPPRRLPAEPVLLLFLFGRPAPRTASRSIRSV